MATPEEQAAAKAKADKDAADKAVTERAQKDAEAAQTEQQRAQAEAYAKEVVEISGGPGAFVIYGHGFGSSGSLTVGGREIKTTSWSDTRIKGTLPEGVKGDVVLTTPSGVRKGVYPAPSKATAPPVKVEVTVTDGKPTAATATVAPK